MEKLLNKLPHIISVVNLGQRENGVFEFSLEAENQFDLRRPLFERLAERKWPLLGLKSSELTLEEVFLTLVDDTNNKFKFSKKKGADR